MSATKIPDHFNDSVVQCVLDGHTFRGSILTAGATFTDPDRNNIVRFIDSKRGSTEPVLTELVSTRLLLDRTLAFLDRDGEIQKHVDTTTNPSTDTLKKAFPNQRPLVDVATRLGILPEAILRKAVSEAAHLELCTDPVNELIAELRLKNEGYVDQKFIAAIREFRPTIPDEEEFKRIMEESKVGIKGVEATMHLRIAVMAAVMEITPGAL